MIIVHALQNLLISARVRLRVFLNVTVCTVSNMFG